MACWIPLFAVVAATLSPPLELTGRFDQRQISEASGIVKSRRNPGIFWVHNDSGNSPVLYAVRLDGSVAQSFPIAVPNIDWEDIAIDDLGRLYIGDIGNNFGLFRVRVIYRFDEPELSNHATSAIVPKASYFFALPASHRFDSESLICFQGLATLIVKAGDGREAELFTLDLAHPAPISRPAALSGAGRLPGFLEPATGAALSIDGQLLAVCSASVLRIYRRGSETAWELLSQVRYQPIGAEGVSWDNRDLILAVEQDGLYRIREETWRQAARESSSLKSKGIRGSR